MPRVERTSLEGSPKGIQASLLSGEEGKGLIITIVAIITAIIIIITSTAISSLT
jgi:hypothetical protein